MKTVKLLLSFALATTLFTSCYVETNIIDDEQEPLSVLHTRISLIREHLQDKNISPTANY